MIKTFIGSVVCALLIHADAYAENARGARFIETLRNGDAVSIATMGTSLTAGRWRWVDAMKEWLDAEWPGQVTIHNLGYGASGSNSGPAGHTGFDHLPRVLAKKANVVFIEFAINDAYIPHVTSVEQSKGNLNVFIDRILETRPDTEIILQTMNSVIDVPEKGTKPATGRPNLSAYYEGYREVARDRGLMLVDHHPMWSKMMNEDRARFLELVPDGIHPLTDSYRQVVLPELKKALVGQD